MSRFPSESDLNGLGGSAAGCAVPWTLCDVCLYPWSCAEHLNWMSFERRQPGDMQPQIMVINGDGSHTLNFDSYEPTFRSPAKGAPPHNLHEGWQVNGSGPASVWPLHTGGAPAAGSPRRNLSPTRRGRSPVEHSLSTAPPSSETGQSKLIKFAGIGPVDETGMPIASRSSVHKPRDWYRSMFKQIHKKTPAWCPPVRGEDPSPSRPAELDIVDGVCPDGNLFGLSPYRALPDCSVTPVTSLLLSLAGLSQEVLAKELSQFQAELDSDIEGMQRRLSQKQHPQSPEYTEYAGENSLLCGLTGHQMKAAHAKFDFQAQAPKELTLQKGDVVYIHRQVDANWYEGEHHGRTGIFPTSYVEIIPPSEKPTPIKTATVQVLEHGEALALFTYQGDLPVELSFRKVRAQRGP
ncbi:UNVERIFIED_CONTAM: hypothetical protein FKN15_005967 [Acipenser sinensis]